MKKIYTLLVLTLFAFSLHSQELPNAGFEEWETFDEGYDEPVSWNTPNGFTSFVPGAPPTVTKSEDAAEGMYSAKLENILIEMGPTIKFYVPGLLTYADFAVDLLTGEFNFGGGLYLPVKVEFLTGKYKFIPAGQDAASVAIYSFSNPEGGEADTTGMGFALLPGVAEWTDFTVPMMPLNDHDADTFNVFILSSTSMGTDSIPVGSALYVDDLSIQTSVGIFNLNGRKTELSVYPNPAIDRISFEAEDSGISRNLRIFDVNGREVRNVEFNGQSLTIGISDLPKGHFTYILQEDKDLLNSGSFIKK